MIYINVKDKNFKKQIMYTFSTIFNNLGIHFKELEFNSELNPNDIVINYLTYTEIEENKFECKVVNIIKSNKLFGENYGLKESIPKKVNYFKLNTPIGIIDNLVSIYGDGDLYLKINDTITTNLDIISDSFFQLSRYEEVLCDERDAINRFKSKNSLAVKEDFILRPIVDEYAMFLLHLIRIYDSSINQTSLWGKSKYVAFISHDIDTISKYKDKFLIKLASSILSKQDLRACRKIVSNYIETILNKKKDPYWNFDYLIEMENKYNFNASYYFMAGGTSSYDNYYNIKNPIVKKVIDKIIENGNEVGIHGSFNSYDNIELLNKETKVLNGIGVKDYGIRQHYLRFKAPESWEIQERIGLRYDTTLSYAEHIGFRCGTCFPYKPYNVKKDTVINIWEIPLIIMDGTLRDAKYQNLSVEESLKFTKNIIDKVIFFGGVFSLLWHNSSLDISGEWKDWDGVYENIIHYLGKNNAMGLSGIDIVKIMEKGQLIIDN